MSAAAWVAAALAGGLGASARFSLDAAVQRGYRGELPLGTLVVNVLGTFMLGILTGLDVSGEWLLVAATGALGSFTTFSTWMLETERLAEEGEGRLAAVNVAAPLAAGAAAAVAGWALGAVL
jgi:CrcB protein